jgi:hypothetical protein
MMKWIYIGGIKSQFLKVVLQLTFVLSRKIRM